MIFIGWSLIRQLDKAGCLCWECHEPDAEGVCNGLEPTSPWPLLSPITNALPEGESNADLAVKYACVVFRGVCCISRGVLDGCERVLKRMTGDDSMCVRKYVCESKNEGICDGVIICVRG